MIKHLVSLEPEMYEHPFDREALKNLSKLPAFNIIRDIALKWTYVKWYEIEMAGGLIEINASSSSVLYSHMVDIADTLNIVRLPKTYIEWNYNIDSGVTGDNASTLMFLYSGVIDLLNTEEQRFEIGHNLGHVKSAHVINQTIAAVFPLIMDKLSIAKSLIEAVYYAILYWKRMSEFTADRTGLLACQDIDIAIDVLMKKAGVPFKYYKNAKRDVFIQQVFDFYNQYENGKTGNSIIKNLSTINNTQPWAIMRVYELIKWMDSGEYQRTLINAAGTKCTNHFCNKIIKKGLSSCPYCGIKY